MIPLAESELLRATTAIQESSGQRLFDHDCEQEPQ
jgi:hypothetical protein